MANSDLIVIFLIVGVVAYFVFSAQINEIIHSATTTAQSTNVANYLQINPKANQQVCNLKLIFQPNLVGLPAFGQNINTAIISGIAGWSLPSGASTVSWTNCHSYGVPASWIPLNYTFGARTIQPNDILLTGAQTVHFNLVVIASDGSQRSYATDPLCLTYCTSVTIPSGVVYVPKQYSFTFVIPNLPRQAYQIQINSELGFNGGNAGTPYIQNVS